MFYINPYKKWKIIYLFIIIVRTMKNNQIISYCLSSKIHRIMINQQNTSLASFKLLPLLIFYFFIVHVSSSLMQAPQRIRYLKGNSAITQSVDMMVGGFNTFSPKDPRYDLVVKGCYNCLITKQSIKNTVQNNQIKQYTLSSVKYQIVSGEKYQCRYSKYLILMPAQIDISIYLPLGLDATAENFQCL